MLTWKMAIAAAGIALLGLCGYRISAQNANDQARKEIDAFNKRYVELHLKMDTPAILALWTEKGVDLMPGSSPMIGRKTISDWVTEIVAKMPGYKVTKQEMEFHDVFVCGDWASEWATVHQEVQPPDGKPMIESYGKSALVLHRETNGEWKVQQEMWNAAPNPGNAR